jgi:hypothetical protein
MKTNIFVATGLTILLAATLGLAQSRKISAKIPFEFTAAGKVLPAGQYDFTYNGNMRIVVVQGIDKGSSVTVPIITWLAGAMHTTPNDAHIVFDKVANNHYLSELWFTDMDGLDLITTKEIHQHEIVNVPR